MSILQFIYIYYGIQYNPNYTTYNKEVNTAVFLTVINCPFNNPRQPRRLEYQEYVNFHFDADLLIHNPRFARRAYQIMITWGCSGHTDALELAVEAKVKKFGLFCHNRERNDLVPDEIIENNRANLQCYADYEKMRSNHDFI